MQILQKKGLTEGSRVARMVGVERRLQCGIVVADRLGIMAMMGWVGAALLLVVQRQRIPKQGGMVRGRPSIMVVRWLDAASTKGGGGGCRCSTSVNRAPRGCSYAQGGGLSRCGVWFRELRCKGEALSSGNSLVAF